MKLLNKINSKADYDNMNDLLIKRILNNNPITNNPMRDGFMIALISSNHKALSTAMIKCDEHETPRYLDGTMQELAIALQWLMENDKEICNIIKENINAK